MVGKCVVVSDFAGQFSSAEINRYKKGRLFFIFGKDILVCIKIMSLTSNSLIIIVS